MSEVRKYKAIGEMTPRSRIGGGEWVRLEDYDAAQSELVRKAEAYQGAHIMCTDLKAELAALRDALSEIIVKVQESRSETRRLNWIEGRCQTALEGKPWAKNVFQMPDPKNGKPKEERLTRELAALREELAKVSREKNDVAYRANETFERLNSMTISKATMQNKLKQRLTAAEQRNAEIDRDAARYRWLRGDSGGQDFVCLSKRGEGMDEAIDAYLKKTTESGASE